MTELEILRAIQADLAGVKADLASVKTDLTGVKTDVAYIRAQVGGHSRQLDVLQQDVRMIRIAINDMERTRVTAGEVEVLHEDFNRLRQGFADLESRVEVMEQDHR
jgi:ubiquinone biosynthesis protein UbiJ